MNAIDKGIIYKKYNNNNNKIIANDKFFYIIFDLTLEESDTITNGTKNKFDLASKGMLRGISSSLKDSKLEDDQSPLNQYLVKRNLNNIEKLGQSSYLELTPEYIEKNFDSSPKTHWQPPKPVLLENFENNIGSQLKDISDLAK